MTNASSSNRTHSGTALLTEPQKKQRYNTNNERAFLAQQAADAKTAMQHTMAEMQATAKEVANVRWWTQQYPWYAVGAATMLGFIAATSVLAPANHRPQPAPPAASQAAARPSWTASLFDMVRSMLMGIIADALHPKGQQASRAQPTQADASIS
jgi:ElaB/YqjD/DUF883 family membrane-anchored ribosome-binding protein